MSSRVLVTGNLGYIGSVLVPFLIDKGYEVVGLDTGYYEDCVLSHARDDIRQIKKDIRDLDEEDLSEVDHIIHLAALSNDPLGELTPGLTEKINFEATIALAKLASESDIKRFVYSSSQSMYGVSELDQELDEYDSSKNPVTSYAKTKWDAEKALSQIDRQNLEIVCFRPSTVFGASPRLRCDIVFNNLVACAKTTGKIEIKSDGTPWRPVVHVKDVCGAYLAGLEAPSKLVVGRSFNVGLENGNFTVRDLAEAASKCVPGSELIFTGEHGSDSRTYRVSFKRIFNELGDYYKPEWDLLRGGKELVDFFDSIDFTEHHFRGPMCNRLYQINKLIETGMLDSELRWKKF